MGVKNNYQVFLDAQIQQTELLAILVDPDKFDTASAVKFLGNIPSNTTHIFVGGSTVESGVTEALVKALKLLTSLPIIIFPGNHTQIAESADALLFLSLLSGRNPEYLIGQQVKSVAKLRETRLEVIPTAYLLINGGNESAVARVTQTSPLDQNDIEGIIDTAKAGELMGAKLLYLEAGSGAVFPVSPSIISAVRQEMMIPIIVGGGIRSAEQRETAYQAGADMVVMGTAYED